MHSFKNSSLAGRNGRESGIRSIPEKRLLINCVFHQFQTPVYHPILSFLFRLNLASLHSIGATVWSAMDIFNGSCRRTFIPVRTPLTSLLMKPALDCTPTRIPFKRHVCKKKLKILVFQHCSLLFDYRGSHSSAHVIDPSSCWFQRNYSTELSLIHI